MPPRNRTLKIHMASSGVAQDLRKSASKRPWDHATKLSSAPWRLATLNKRGQ
jgi:hypothetical protein